MVETSSSSVWNFLLIYFPPLSLAVALFLVIQQLILSIHNRSILDASTYAALPTMLWFLLAESFKPSLKGRGFTPAFLLSVMVISYATFLLYMLQACTATLSLIFTLTMIGHVIIYTRSLTYDPGFIPMGIRSQGENPQYEMSKTSEQGSGQHSDLSVVIDSTDEQIKALKQEESAVNQISKSETSKPVNSELTKEQAPETSSTLNPSYESLFCYDCYIWKWARSKHCRICKRCVDRFDHHCPAIGTCVGRRNHPLFMAVVAGYIVAEGLYVVCSVQYLKSLQSMGSNNDGISFLSFILVNSKSGTWIVGVAVFLFIQILWQVPLLLFHCYGICFNITTQEFAKWRKNPYWYVEVPPQPGYAHSERRFFNPYDRGVWKNMVAFFNRQEVSFNDPAES